MMIDDKCATIVPVSHLYATVYDKYLMALSIGCESPGYVSFFRDLAREGQYVILDNSTVELGEPESFVSYIAKVLQMEAKCLVLPDYFHDRERTIQADRDALEVIDRCGYFCDIMAIPQGVDTEDWTRCCGEMLREIDPDVIGISYRYNDMFEGCRDVPVEIARTLSNDTVRIHLLGCQGNPQTEVSHLLALDYVQGVDSSFASLITKYGEVLTAESVRRPHTAIDLVHDQYDGALLRTNIASWRRLCNNASLT